MEDEPRCFRSHCDDEREDKKILAVPFNDRDLLKPLDLRPGAVNYYA